jgi:hypothetical protein
MIPVVSPIKKQIDKAIDAPTAIPPAKPNAVPLTTALTVPIIIPLITLPVLSPAAPNATALVTPLTNPQMVPLINVLGPALVEPTATQISIYVAALMALARNEVLHWQLVPRIPHRQHIPKLNRAGIMITKSKGFRRTSKPRSACPTNRVMKLGRESISRSNCVGRKTIK